MESVLFKIDCSLHRDKIKLSLCIPQNAKIKKKEFKNEDAHSLTYMERLSV